MPYVEFHGLNISAMPHPQGIYRELFERVASKRVNYFGDKIAAISKPSKTKDGLFWGLIHSWTEIDKSQKVIDTVLLRIPEPTKLAQLKIPDDLGFNSQVFYYVFRESDHTLIFESKNSEGRTLAPLNAERIFLKLFDDSTLRRLKFQLEKPNYVEVDLVIESSALDTILAISHLKTLNIQFSVPNDDDNTDEADKIIERLKTIKARSQSTTYKAVSSKEGIKADDVVRAEGKAALRHGFITGQGTDKGKNVTLSSKSYPRQERAYVDKEASTLDTALLIARKFITRALGT